MAGAGGSGGGLAGFERELICSICTELLYQPLTILNCLHTFCGSCLKEWFSHQHRKASSSRSTPSSANPYSCPTCRADVKDVHHNATVSNLLELFLMANPARARSQEEKDDMDKIYKPDGTSPGAKILPKVERRRERRSRRDDRAAAREEEQLEEARQRSRQDLDNSSQAVNLSPPTLERNRSISGEREERRQRRRERERQREQASSLTIPPFSQPQPVHDESVASSPPASSPRHPDAVEARQRAHRMSHQASLRSLVSASESGTGTGDSLDEARIMQEIIDEGLLGDIDVDALTEAEQDMLAERIADLIRQRHPRRSDTGSPTPLSHASTHPSPDRSRLREDHQQHLESGHRPPPAQLSPPQSELRPCANSARPQAPPPSAIGRSNSHGSSVTIHHRRRTSDQPRQAQSASRSRATSIERPSSSSPTNSASDTRPTQQVTLTRSRSVNSTRNNTEPNHSPRASEAWLQAGGEDRRLQTRNAASPSHSPRPAYTMPVASTSQFNSEASNGATQIAELDGNSSQSAKLPQRRYYDEPSIVCFRCHKPELQYDIFRHCRSCNVDLCMRCYRQGKGCRHWYGFGHAAEVNFENSKTRDESTEEPHVLIARQYRRPLESNIAQTKTSTRTQELVPSTTSSNPTDRLQEGHFCDRCGTFANTQFWLCDICNDGEWGFCKQCVQTHHCCTHPLLPVAYYPQSLPSTFDNLHLNNTQSTGLLPAPPPTLRINPASAGNSRPHTPNSTTSFTSHSRRESGYDYLSIDVSCDICHQIIYPQSLRYHCPSHSTDYDICTSCYSAFIQHSRTRRDGHSAADVIAGWRRCPQSHRMIVVAFEADISDEGDGGMRRIIKEDLVGGRKISDADIRAWNSQHNLYASPPTSPPLSNRGTWSWKEDSTGTRRGMRSRSSTLTSMNNGTAGLPSSNMKFPPNGGLGKQGVAYYAYWPEDGEDGAGELNLPRGAEVLEIEDVNGDWWSGVYAGDVGIFPFGYVREYR